MGLQKSSRMKKETQSEAHCQRLFPKYGEDCGENFAPVVKHTTIRVLLSSIKKHGLSSTLKHVQETLM